MLRSAGCPQLEDMAGGILADIGHCAVDVKLINEVHQCVVIMQLRSRYT